jgi:hypothetical protein
MTRKSIQEIKFSSHKDCLSKFDAHINRMPIVSCVCGFEILVIPDLKAMNLAIINHLAEHTKVRENSEELAEFLAQQVIIVAGGMNLSF